MENRGESRSSRGPRSAEASEGSASASATSAGTGAHHDIYQLAFEQMSDAVIIGEIVPGTDGRPADYRIVDVNPAYERLVRQKADRVIGTLLSDVNPRMRPELLERAAGVTAGGEPAEFETHDPESNRSVRIRISRVGPTWVMAMVEDVTEARNAEAALRERNAFVETIITSSGDGLIVYDHDLKVAVWNPAMEDLTGLSAAFVIGRDAFEAFPEVMDTGVGDDLREALAGAEPTSREFEYVIPRTGRRGWAVQTNRRHRNANGEIVGVVSAVRDITAEHEIEAAIRRSEAEFRTIFDNVGDGVAISEPGGQFLEVNRVVCERLGYTREQLLAMPVASINSPEAAELIPERTLQAAQDGTSVFETAHVTRDGTKIPIEGVSRRVEFRGRPAILTVQRDITQRRQSEEAVREQARFLQQMLDAIPIPIIAKDRAGRIQLCNATFAAAGGRRPADVVGRTIAELGIPESELHWDTDRDLLATGKPQVYEAPAPSADGGLRRHVITKAPLRDPDGDINGIVTAALDIDDRYEAEQALRRSEERFRTLFESAADAIFISDREGKFIEANPAACERLGYGKEELLGLSVADLSLPGMAPSIVERIATIERHGGLVFETVHLNRDGTAIPVEMIATMIELGGQPAVLGIARDISERKKSESERAALEEQLRQAQKMEGIGRLAGGIAHDFNNLLTVIRGNASLALGELQDEEAAREDLEQIELAADRAAALTRQLLAFARRTVLKPEVVDPSLIVRRLEPMLRRLIGEDIVLEIVAPVGGGHVLVDPGQLEQVIVNLVVNARDAMPDGGTVTIEVADIEMAEAITPERPDSGGPMTMLSVSDTGIGMDAATLERLFEPFFTTKDPARGTGLGLATVYGIVRMSGGKVTARSELGSGSTLTVYLPRVDAVASPEPPGAAPPASTGAGTILVVEDDRGVRRFACRVLEAAGYTVLTASDGAEALELSADVPVDLLLTDVVMPGMSGRDVAARLAAARPGIRTLYMSGHTDKGIVRDGVLEPGIEFLAKPFTAEALLAAVDAAMTGHAAG